MAIGMVWVFPGILPANMKVAPNSPNARARLKILPDIRALEAKGIEIKKKMAHSSAPSTLLLLQFHDLYLEILI